MQFSTKHAVAQLLSYTFHPGILPTVGSLFILYSLPELFGLQALLQWTGIVLVGSYLVPLLIIYLLSLLGVIENVHLIRKQDRIYPYTATIFSMLLTARILMRIGAPVELPLSTIGSAFVLTISTALIPFFKSSAHAAGCFGFLGMYVALHEKYAIGSLQGLLCVILVCIAVCWGRIALNRHTLIELLSGAIIGFGSLYILLSR